MSRTQKKCFIASTGVHLLLLLVLLFGPGFLSSGDKPENSEILTFIPTIVTDEKAYNPGEAATRQQATAQPPQPQAAPVTPPPVVPPTPAPKPEPEKISEPEPPKNLKPNPEALEAEKPPKTKPKPQISTKMVTRNTDDVRKAAQKQVEQNAAAERRQLAAALGKATSSLKTGLSGSTEIKFSDGLGVGGGSGPAYGNWLSAVQTVYYSNWDVPAGAAEDLETTASVTIARDGTILTARIIRRSGNAAMDKSVEAALDRVRSVLPFPAGAKEDQRPLNIVFKPIKQLLG